MSDDFGSELVNVQSEYSTTYRVPLSDFEVISGAGVDLSDYYRTHLRERFGAPTSPLGFRPGVVLYFAPGRYFLPHDSGAVTTRYEFPENVQLFFATGAWLRPALHVEVILRGSIRAGKHQIFGYDRYAPTSPA